MSVVAVMVQLVVAALVAVAASLLLAEDKKYLPLASAYHTSVDRTKIEMLHEETEGDLKG